jgi:transcriptional regulator with XRE-family HTH domain
MSSGPLSSDPAFLAAYGDAIRLIRDGRGMDRKGLADAAGISYSYLSAIESGQRLPSEAVQDAIAAALDIEPSELLARANGAIAVRSGDTPDPTLPTRAVAVEALADTLLEHVEPAGTDTTPVASAPPSRAGASITASGALAELRSLIPTLSPEDTALVVSMARRLADGERPRRSPARTTYRGRAGRESRTEAYLRFWTTYLDQLDEQGLDWARGRSAEPRSYFTTPSRLRGASLSASFARNRMLRHELYINRGSRTANLELLHELESHRGLIEEAYGHELEFEDPGRDRRAVRIAEYREGHISRSDEFDDYIDWFIDRGACMRTAIEGYLAVR